MERRTHRRYAALLRATVKTGSQRWDVTCTNISMGGGFLEGRSQPALGTRVEVVLWPTEPSGTLFVLQATVVYQVHPGGRRGPGFGVEWQAPDDKRLGAILSRVAADPNAREPWREQQTAEFDVGEAGCTGTGVTQKYQVRPKSQPAQADR